MKKIFSLFAAALVVLSVNAAQALPKLNRSQAQAIKAGFAHKAKTNKLHAPALVQDQSLTFDDCEAWGYDSYYEDGSWDLNLYNGQDYVGFLAIMGDCDATHICGTYDIADAIDGYPGAQFIINGDTCYAISGSFEVTYVSSADGVPTYNVSGSLVCNNGETVVLDNDFPVTYAIDYYSYMLYYYQYTTTFDFIELEDAPFVPTGDTISVVIPGKVDIMYFASDNDYYIMGNNDDYSISIDLLASGSELETGYYMLSNGDFWEKYCGIYDPATGVAIASLVDLEVAITVTTDTTFFTAWYTLNDGNVYEVDAKYFVLTPTDTITATIDGRIDNYIANLGALQLVCEDSNYELFVTVEADQVAGSYTDADNYIDQMGYNYTGLSVINGTDTAYYSFESFEMEITISGTDTTATVSYLTKDAVLYIFNVNVNPTAINELAEKMGRTQKVLRNGQVLFIRKEATYNVAGARLH